MSGGKGNIDFQNQICHLCKQGKQWKMYKNVCQGIPWYYSTYVKAFNNIKKNEIHFLTLGRNKKYLLFYSVLRFFDYTVKSNISFYGNLTYSISKMFQSYCLTALLFSSDMVSKILSS